MHNVSKYLIKMDVFDDLESSIYTNCGYMIEVWLPTLPCP